MLADGTTLPFEYLILATGSVSDTKGACKIGHLGCVVYSSLLLGKAGRAFKIEVVATVINESHMHARTHTHTHTS